MSTDRDRVLPRSRRGRDTLPVHPQLRAIADARLGVFTSREALAIGYRVEDVRAELSTRRWLRLRRGVYVAADDVDTSDARQRHHEHEDDGDDADRDGGLAQPLHWPIPGADDGRRLTPHSSAARGSPGTAAERRPGSPWWVLAHGRR